MNLLLTEHMLRMQWPAVRKSQLIKKVADRLGVPVSAVKLVPETEGKQ